MNRLTQLLRDGSQGRTQARFTFYILLPDGTEAVCALGAMASELGAEWATLEPDPDEVAEFIQDRTGIDLYQSVLTPSGGYQSLLQAIVVLNDTHQLSFAEIADWLDTLVLEEDPVWQPF